MDRKTLITICGTMTVWGGFACWVIKKQDERYSRLMTTANINFRVVELFAERADPELVNQIMREVEFDWVTKDLHD